MEVNIYTLVFEIKIYVIGTVQANKICLIGTVPANKNNLKGTLDTNSSYENIWENL